MGVFLGWCKTGSVGPFSYQTVLKDRGLKAGLVCAADMIQAPLWAHGLTLPFAGQG